MKLTLLLIVVGIVDRERSETSKNTITTRITFVAY